MLWGDRGYKGQGTGRQTDRDIHREVTGKHSEAWVHETFLYTIKQLGQNFSNSELSERYFTFVTSYNF